MFKDKAWLIMGDFNEILEATDHSSSSRISPGCREFQRFTNQCGIMDLAKSGPRFTWTNKQQEQPINKRLDRALINDSWLQNYPNSYAVFDAGGCSDHARCIVDIKGSPMPAIKKPFKFVNVLVENQNFLPTVENYWNRTDKLFISTSAIYRFSKKLKELKGKLRELSRSSLGDLTKKTREAYEILCNKQNEVLDNPNCLTLAEEAEANNRWTSLAAMEENYLKQKSKIHWLRLGDMNNKYFHRQAEARKAKNAIRIIQVPSGARVTDLDTIKDEAVRHFRDHLQTLPCDYQEADITVLQDLITYRCSEDINAALTREVSDEEIQKVLFSMPSNKAPGPDGYTKEFFTAAWQIVGSDFLVAVKSFFAKGFLPHGVNSTILTLIPKKDEVFEMKDYRPIACCNVIYKVISKLIANRLKVVLPLFIADNQCAFIQERLLLENVLLASELVQGYHLPNISERCAIKFDISKAFDTIQWDFIILSMRAMQFPDTFIHWIYLCISTPSFSVQVNGELAGYFSSMRGIRQGCALSPYLFVLSMNVLSAMLDKSALRGDFGFHPRCRSAELTHLCFVDDIMVFTDGKYKSIEGVSKVFDKFARMSGLHINSEKTSLFLAGGNANTMQHVSTNLRYVLDTLPIKYLGLPLLTRRMARTDYMPLIDKVQNRMANWCSRLLSFAGRYQLISSVISGVIQFWAATFWLPRECIKEIERMCSAFLWSGVEMNARSAKLPWQDVFCPKEEGRLGFRDIKEANMVYGMKLVWKLLATEKSLWVRWVRKNLLKRKPFWLVKGNQGSWIWKKLLKLRDKVLPFTRNVIQDGNSTLFWLDNWTPHGPLIERVGEAGPSRLGVPLDATVKEAYLSRIIGRDYRNEILNQIESTLGQLALTDEKDSIHWRHGPDTYKEVFSTKLTWNQIRRKQDRKQWSKMIWFKLTVPKYAFMTWLTMKNRLSTLDRIARWLPSIDTSCVLCTSSAETREHLFFQCPYSRRIWRDLAGKMMGSQYTTNWNSLVYKLSCINTDMECKTLQRMAFQTTLYHIWIERNNRRHNNISSTSRQLLARIDKAVRNKISASRPPNDQSSSALMIRWLSFKT